MKRFLSLVLAVVMVVVFGTWNGNSVFAEEDTFEPSNPESLQRLQDDVYANLEEQFASDDFTVENVQVSYVSQEYLDELAFNSQENIFFGYTLSEVKAMYPEDYYVFTLGDDGATAVEKFTPYDSSFPLETVIKNVAIGAGVILLCATVSYLTAGTGTPKMIQVIYAISTGATKVSKVLSLSYALSSGITSGLMKYVQTGDTDKALQTGLVQGSNGFKIGAIVGAAVGGVQGAMSSIGVPTPSEAEQAAYKRYDNGTARTQVSYIDGVECSSYVKGSTRPDVVRTVDGHIEAIEVKCYDLENNSSSLYAVLEKQIGERMQYLPEGSTQRVVLDVTGRKYKQSFVNEIVEQIKTRCAPIYPDLPVDLVWSH